MKSESGDYEGCLFGRCDG